MRFSSRIVPRNIKVWNCQLVGFSPVDFIHDPLLWPKLITKYKATQTVAPHFGYQLTARRMELAGPGLELDLSSLTFPGTESDVVHADPHPSSLFCLQVVCLLQYTHSLHKPFHIFFAGSLSEVVVCSYWNAWKFQQCSDGRSCLR